MIDYRPNQVQRVSEEIFGETVSAVMALTGGDPELAESVVDAVFGRLQLATRTQEWTEGVYPCGHAYWTIEGEWKFCVERGLHGRHEDDEGEVWPTGVGRDVDMRALQGA